MRNLREIYCEIIDTVPPEELRIKRRIRKGMEYTLADYRPDLDVKTQRRLWQNFCDVLNEVLVDPDTPWKVEIQKLLAGDKWDKIKELV